MARPRAPQYALQRELILRKAAELFAQQGYGGASMNEVAQACGVSKAALYHYVKDKSQLLVEIALEHVARLEAVVQEVLVDAAGTQGPQQRMQALIVRFVQEYADARHEHRVLTEDVKFLEPADRRRVVQAQKRVVNAFAQTVGELRPELVTSGLHKAVTMLLFGMINWMFTWLRPQGPLTHERMAPIVCELFFGGLSAVSVSAQDQSGPIRSGPAAPNVKASPISRKRKNAPTRPRATPRQTKGDSR